MFNPIKLLLYFFIAVTLNMLSLTLYATTANSVELAMSNGLVATAEFHGEHELSTTAILLVHGFLQTREFLTVNTLMSSLADAGYTVLAPTLSLGVQKRKQSLACEAIHSHTMNDDLNEIDNWVKWLTKRGYRNVILVGHSYGSLQVLAYHDEKNNPAVKKIIATSLVDVEHVLGREKTQLQLRRARVSAKQDTQALGQYRLSFCGKYIAPHSAFLSYAEWSKKRVLSIISSLKVPLQVILGQEDSRMGENWPGLVKAQGANVTLITGANHFFDSTYEFDLLDEVIHAVDQSK